MGRFSLGIILLALLLGLGLWISQTADDQLLPIARTLEEAAREALEQDTQQATEKTAAARKRWEKAWHATAAFSDHEPMEQIDSLFAQLPCWEGAPDRYAAVCNQIAMLIRALSGVHEPVWWNLL